MIFLIHNQNSNMNSYRLKKLKIVHLDNQKRKYFLGQIEINSMVVFVSKVIMNKLERIKIRSDLSAINIWCIMKDIKFKKLSTLWMVNKDMVVHVWAIYPILINTDSMGKDLDLIIFRYLTILHKILLKLLMLIMVNPKWSFLLGLVIQKYSNNSWILVMCWMVKSQHT